MMTDFKKIFFDTAPIIYYLENNKQYYARMKSFWEKYEDCDYITSAITVTEYLKYPYQHKSKELVDSFYSFLDGMDIDIKCIDKSVADKAARIRAEFPSFKTMDALQLATACIFECDLFLTNDKQLKQFKEINCLTIEEV